MSHDLVTQLKEQAFSDHVRGCEGRQYSCDCGYDIRTEGLLEQAATALTEARAEIERLRAEVYVPGQWRCAKCKFTLQQMNLNANTGTVTARDNAGDKCPNCNSPLWRATWKQDAHEMLDRATEQMERVKVAESELSTLRARVREVVGPFSRLCEMHVDDDDRDSTGIIFPESRAVVQVGHLRAASQLMEEVK